MDRERKKIDRQPGESNAEQAVIKHFEESLRRAKEKVFLFFHFSLSRSSALIHRIYGGCCVDEV